MRKKILIFTAIILFIVSSLFYFIFINRAFLYSGPLTPVLPKFMTGKCPPGLYDYGVPLGCVSKETIERCKTQLCPICLASNSKISTPEGSVYVSDLNEGSFVWSLNRDGKKIKSKVIRVSSIEAKNHYVYDLKLADGREVWVSPNHPTNNGLTIAKLNVGKYYDGSKIISKLLVPYWANKTYDLLPDSDTGYYWANGIMLGSTLE